MPITTTKQFLRTHRAFIVLLLLLQFAANGRSQVSDTGSISGRITDADTQMPLEGVRVGSTKTGWAVTDASGQYNIRDVAPSQLHIGIENFYLSASLAHEIGVTVRARQETAGVNFRVRLNAEISGRVLNEAGDPLPGVRVTAFDPEYQRQTAAAEYTNGEPWYNAGGFASTTDDQGKYTIRGLYAGRPYRVLAFRAVVPDAVLSEAPFDPLARSPIQVPTYYPHASAFDRAESVVLHSLEHRSNLDIQMRNAQPYCLEATLVADGKPAKMRFALAEQGLHTALSPNSRLRETGDDGRIRLCDLFSGQFELEVSVPTFGAAIPRFSAVVPITISDKDVRNMTVQALPSITIASEVLFEEDRTPINPIANPTLRASVYPPSSASSTIPIPGSFSFQASPGVRTSIAIYMKAPLYVKDIVYGGTSILHQTFKPISGAERIRIVVGRDGGSISARVGVAGQFVPNASVIILPEAAQTESALAGGLVTGYTDEQGMFVAEALAPGRYYVLATEDPPPSMTLQPSGQLDIAKTPETIGNLLEIRSRGERVVVTPGGNAQVNVASRPLK